VGDAVDDAVQFGTGQYDLVHPDKLGLQVSRVWVRQQGTSFPASRDGSLKDV